MSKYHYLIAGLPDITLDDSKQVYSVETFKDEVFKLLSRRDKKLMNLFFLKYDNQNLLDWLKDPTGTEAADLDGRGTVSPEEFMGFIEAYMETETDKKKEKIQKAIPSYVVKFLEAYQNEVLNTGKKEEDETEDEEKEPLPITWDDRLAALYYDYAIKSGNTFFSAWFELNLTIKNILTAVTCRKHGLDSNLYIIGNNEIASNLRTSTTRDFNLGDMVDFLPELLRLAEETDLVSREKQIDLLKWEWLEEKTIFKVFDIESVFAYLLKIEMIERWTNLDQESGETAFRTLINAMKKDSNTALDEFKKKNNKK